MKKKFYYTCKEDKGHEDEVHGVSKSHVLVWIKESTKNYYDDNAAMAKLQEATFENPLDFDWGTIWSE